MDFLCVNNSNLPPILHTVSEIWQITGPIFALQKECLSRTSWHESLNSGREIWPKPEETRNIPLSSGERVFRYLESFRHDSRVCRTDRRTDRLANSMCGSDYVARSTMARVCYGAPGTTIRACSQRYWHVTKLSEFREQFLSK